MNRKEEADISCGTEIFQMHYSFDEAPKPTLLLAHRRGNFPGGINAAAALKRKLKGQTMAVHKVVAVALAGMENTFEVEGILGDRGPQENIIISEDTAINITTKSNGADNSLQELTSGLESLALTRLRNYQVKPPPGLEKAFALAMDLALLNKSDIQPELREALPAALCVSGPAGCGKSLLKDSLTAALRAMGVHCLSITGPALLMGETMPNQHQQDAQFPRERDIITANQLFENLEQHQPSVLFLDEMDCLAEDGPEAMQAATSLLSRICNISSAQSCILTFGFTRKAADDLPLAFSRAGCFEKFMTIDLATEEERIKIIEALLVELNISPDDQEQWPKKLAKLTPGFYGGDLRGMCAAALRGALIDLVRNSETVGNDTVQKVFDVAVDNLIANVNMTWGHFQKALQKIKPIALAEYDVQNGADNLSWSSVGGYQTVIQRLKQLVDGPLEYPETYKRLGLSGTSGILLHGPSGCGKSMIAQVLASEVRANFVWVHSTELLSKYLGETEMEIRRLFKKARESRPCILFFDELDAICANREKAGDQNSLYTRVLSTLLNELDGISGMSHGVLVLGATNRFDALDAAMLRPGRLSEHVFLGKPTKEDKVQIYKIHSANMPLSEDVKFEVLASDARFQHLTGADIKAVCREAGLNALRETIDKQPKQDNEINLSHFLSALKTSTFSFFSQQDFSFL